jgi:hypothetical protein
MGVSCPRSGAYRTLAGAEVDLLHLRVVKVASVADLVGKLKNEAGVL